MQNCLYTQATMLAFSIFINTASTCTYGIVMVKIKGCRAPLTTRQWLPRELFTFSLATQLFCSPIFSHKFGLLNRWSTFL